MVILLAQPVFASPGAAGELGVGGTSGFALPDSKRNCSLCHLTAEAKQGSAALKRPVRELCVGCHPDRKSPNEHKIDITVSPNAGNLPLIQGTMTCTTCHDPHRNPYGNLLRLPERDLCSACHPY